MDIFLKNFIYVNENTITLVLTIMLTLFLALITAIFAIKRMGFAIPIKTKKKVYIYGCVFLSIIVILFISLIVT